MLLIGMPYNGSLKFRCIEVSIAIDVLQVEKSTQQNTATAGRYRLVRDSHLGSHKSRLPSHETL